jgi:hypothetical protein
MCFDDLHRGSVCRKLFQSTLNLNCFYEPRFRIENNSTLLVWFDKM